MRDAECMMTRELNQVWIEINISKGANVKLRATRRVCSFSRTKARNVYSNNYIVI